MEPVLPFKRRHLLNEGVAVEQEVSAEGRVNKTDT